MQGEVTLYGDMPAWGQNHAREHGATHISHQRPPNDNSRYSFNLTSHGSTLCKWTLAKPISSTFITIPTPSPILPVPAYLFPWQMPPSLFWALVKFTHSSRSSLSLYFTNPSKHSCPSHVNAQAEPIINLGLLAFHSCISCLPNTVINSRGSSLKPLSTSKSGSQPVVYQEPWISVPSNFKQFIEFIFIQKGATLL